MSTYYIPSNDWNTHYIQDSASPWTPPVGATTVTTQDNNAITNWFTLGGGTLFNGNYQWQGHYLDLIRARYPRECEGATLVCFRVMVQDQALPEVHIDAQFPGGRHDVYIIQAENVVRIFHYSPTGQLLSSQDLTKAPEPDAPEVTNACERDARFFFEERED